MCQKNASHGLYKFCLVFDPTQYDHTIEDELHWGGWDDAIAIIHSFIHSFFLSFYSIPFVFFANPRKNHKSILLQKYCLDSS
jgi:hypothetical protein